MSAPVDLLITERSVVFASEMSAFNNAARIRGYRPLSNERSAAQVRSGV